MSLAKDSMNILVKSQRPLSTHIASIGETLVKGIKKYVYTLPRHFSPVVKHIDNLANVALRTIAKELAKAILEAHNRKVATVEYQHAITSLDMLLGPIAQLVGLTLASLTKKWQHRIVTIVKLFEQSR